MHIRTKAQKLKMEEGYMDKEDKEVFEKIHRDVSRVAKLWTYLAGFALIMTPILLYSLGRDAGVKSKKILTEAPIKIEYLHLNSDSIEDRVFSNNAGLHQEQFGYENSKTGKLEYLTLEEIKKGISAESDEKIKLSFQKYDFTKGEIRKVQKKTLRKYMKNK